MRGYGYILTNKNNSVLYTGVTSNLKERIIQHKTRKHPHSFSARYNLGKLVHFECLDSIWEAIKREKQIKAGPRRKKLELINRSNPELRDLSFMLDDL